MVRERMQIEIACERISDKAGYEADSLSRELLDSCFNLAEQAETNYPLEMKFVLAFLAIQRHRKILQLSCDMQDAATPAVAEGILRTVEEAFAAYRQPEHWERVRSTDLFKAWRALLGIPSLRVTCQDSQGTDSFEVKAGDTIKVSHKKGTEVLVTLTIEAPK